MPYLTHFALDSQPFTLTPNRALYYPDSHQHILDAATFALKRGEGLLKVVGEVGTGKSLLCRLLLDAVDGDMATAFIAAPQQDQTAVMRTVAKEFALPLDEQADAYLALEHYLLELARSGTGAVLVIDEAQALDRPGLEAVRLLTNLETDTRKLLQVVLFGQPELNTLLARHDMRQLAQRVSFAFTTQPLPRDQVAGYIQARIDACALGQRPHTLFTPAAVRLIARASGGIPRTINLLADKALMAAYAEGARQAARRHVRMGMRETPVVAARGRGRLAGLLGARPSSPAG